MNELNDTEKSFRVLLLLGFSLSSVFSLLFATTFATETSTFIFSGLAFIISLICIFVLIVFKGENDK